MTNTFIKYIIIHADYEDYDDYITGSNRGDQDLPYTLKVTDDIREKKTENTSGQDGREITLDEVVVSAQGETDTHLTLETSKVEEGNIVNERPVIDESQRADHHRVNEVGRRRHSGRRRKVLDDRRRGRERLNGSIGDVTMHLIDEETYTHREGGRYNHVVTTRQQTDTTTIVKGEIR